MSAERIPADIVVHPDSLVIACADGTTLELSSLWLHDNSPAHRDPHNGQRLVDIADLPPAPRIRSAVETQGTVRIEWQSEPQDTVFDLAWLIAQRAGARARRPELAVRRWLEGATLDAKRDFAWAALHELREAPPLRLSWLTRLLQDGIAFVREVPCTEPAILKVMELVGRVADTNYGRVFDVRSVPEPENLAYSDLGLGLHTDNPYREPVPGFQALHALIASPDGGDSVFADGFALAEHLRASEAQTFARLTRTPVPFHYRSPSADLYAERPLIRLSCDGEVVAVHYNGRSIAPLNLPLEETAAFYAAYRRFAALLRAPRHQMTMRLASGDLVVFDNQRILHGRSAFLSARHARHLRGCYLTRDSVYSTTALLRRELERDAR
jgi:gamma-butyrobetaine dioxygenase